MAKNVFVGILLGAIALASAGCSTVNQAVGESMALGAPVQDIEAELALYRNYFAPEPVMKCLALPRATPERRSCRDLITYARMRYIDLQYGVFRQRVFAEVNGANAVTDITVLGLNAAGTLVGGATTKSILAAISGGLVGAKGIINKDVLYNAGIQTLILKMDADRTAVRLRITNNLKQNEEVYPFEAAELDTGDYYRVGTVPNALITLQGNAAATLSYDTAVINSSVPQVPAPSPPGISIATPPPLPVTPPPPPPPPVPTPPPVAAAPPLAPPPSPVVIPPAFPPPPPVPGPPPSAGPKPLPGANTGGATTVRVTPETPDQIAFRAAYRSLKRDDKGVLTPESRQIVDQCSAPFFPVQTPIAEIRLQGGANLKAITACIKSKT